MNKNVPILCLLATTAILYAQDDISTKQQIKIVEGDSIVTDLTEPIVFEERIGETIYVTYEGKEYTIDTLQTISVPSSKSKILLLPHSLNHLLLADAQIITLPGIEGIKIQLIKTGMAEITVCGYLDYNEDRSIIISIPDGLDMITEFELSELINEHLNRNSSITTYNERRHQANLDTYNTLNSYIPMECIAFNPYEYIALFISKTKNYLIGYPELCLDIFIYNKSKGKHPYCFSKGMIEDTVFIEELRIDFEKKMDELIKDQQRTEAWKDIKL